MKKILFLFSLFCIQFLFGQTDTVYVYGPGGPYPAFQEVANAFEKEHQVKVLITKGPLPKWKEEAQLKADLIFSGSENMMTQFIGIFKDQIDPTTVYPLFYRGSGLIVRKGNPKKIKKLSDLKNPDVKIMVVQGAGLTGVWEDILGSMRNMDDFRSIRKQIVYFADNSGLAEKQWKENPEIDVWISWNIWQMANQDTADFVKLSKKHTIYRNTGMALTQKGKSKNAAQLFYRFLQTKKAQSIFNQMGWQ